MQTCLKETDFEEGLYMLAVPGAFDQWGSPMAGMPIQKAFRHLIVDRAGSF